MGSNMAECHPVAFRWPMKAKLNGAKLVHVDPRFTRTSAVADLHVPIRAGSDIAFLGGLINYVVNSKRWNTDPFFKEFAVNRLPIRAGSDIAFLGGLINYVVNSKRWNSDPFFKEFVVNYTNAATIIADDFKDTEDLDGVFSGMVKFTEPAFWPYNGLEGRYDNATWAYKRGPKPPRTEIGAVTPGELARVKPGATTKDLIAKRAGPPFDDLVRSLKPGPAERDPTLQHPHCVFQILKRHFSRYTPEMVEQVCGSPKEKFIKVAEMLLENSGRERTSAFAYAPLRPPAEVPRLVLQVDVRHRGDGGERFRLRLAPEDPGRPLPHRHVRRHGGRQGQGDVLRGPEPRHVAQWRGHAAGAAATRLARGQGQLAYRDGDTLVSRARGEERRGEDRRHQDRDLLLPLDPDRRVRRQLHQHATHAAVALQGVGRAGRLPHGHLVLPQPREAPQEGVRQKLAVARPGLEQRQLGFRPGCGREAPLSGGARRAQDPA